MLLVLAALPALFWDGAPDTASALRDAGIKQIVIPASRAAAWKGIDGIATETADLEGAVKLVTPTVNYRMNEASATNAPWIMSNGWRIMRRPGVRYYYEVTGRQTGIAAAEAFAYGARALIKSDTAGLKPLAEMLEFLGANTSDPLPTVADIGYIDDGSAASGEVMNLMVRNNLLFQIVPSPDRRFKINVKLGTPDYPLADAKNPSTVAHQARFHLTDERRSLRVYGSQVVVARLTASGDSARIHLLNYGGASRVVSGIRVRVLGKYTKRHLAAAGSTGTELLDYSLDTDSTEFTVPELKTYAVVDLSR
jgi:hypothetical protein